MSIPSAVAGARPDVSATVMRLPGAVPKDGGVDAVQDQAEKAKAAPPPPRVSYDPTKVRENLRSAIEHLNKQLASSGRSLGFSMDDVINYPIVTVKSTQTGEVIRQIPSEAVVRVAHTLDELKGLLHDAVT
jgi:flagellar protein FlaG